MIKFITFTAKVQLNVHDLNNEAVAGNVTDIRIMEFIDEIGNRVEAPAVSGRMLKHWHYEGMRHLVLNGGYSSIPLCAACRIGEPIRPGEIKENKLRQVANREEKAISECALCDIHGYLIAQGAEGEEKGTSNRRTSRVMFSWLMPVLGCDTTQKQVIHTRVSQQGSVAEGEAAAQMIFNKSYASGIFGEKRHLPNRTMQMIFNKSYASGIYAFVSAFDVDRVGLVELNLGAENPYAIDDSGRKERIKVAIEAYRLIISGQIGASLSHALPHQNPIEVLVAYSETGPLPFPVSPIYSDYKAKTIGLMPQGTKFLYWGNEPPAGIESKNTIDEIFKTLISLI